MVVRMKGDLDSEYVAAGLGFSARANNTEPFAVKGNPL